MRSVNKVILIGHAGKDPELRHTPGGAAVAEFSLATTERWKKDGEVKERTDWHTITAWGKLAEIVNEYVKKGQPIYVEGAIRMESWEKDGKTQYRTKIQAQTLNILVSREATDKPAKPEKPAEQADPGFDDDLPF